MPSVWSPLVRHLLRQSGLTGLPIRVAFCMLMTSCSALPNMDGLKTAFLACRISSLGFFSPCKRPLGPAVCASVAKHPALCPLTPLQGLPLVHRLSCGPRPLPSQSQAPQLPGPQVNTAASCWATYSTRSSKWHPLPCERVKGEPFTSPPAPSQVCSPIARWILSGPHQHRMPAHLPGNAGSSYLLGPRSVSFCSLW